MLLRCWPCSLYFAAALPDAARVTAGNYRNGRTETPQRLAQSQRPAGEIASDSPWWLDTASFLAAIAFP